MSHMISKFTSSLVLIPFFIIPLIFMGLGISLSLQQQHKIMTYQPIEVNILSERLIRSDSGESGTTYRAEITYSYTIDGKTYESSNVFPIKISGPRSQAQRILDQFEPEETAEGFYNPENPSQAFLIKKYSILPYIFILFPVLFLCVAGWASAGIRSGNTDKKPIPSSTHGFEIKPSLPIASIKKGLIITFLFWFVIGCLACGHYAYVTSYSFGITEIVVFSIYFVIGFLLLVGWFYYKRMSEGFSDTQLFVDQERFFLGTDLNVTINWTIYQNIYIQNLTLSLKCIHKYKSGKSTRKDTHYEQKYPLLDNHNARAGELINLPQTISIPADKKPGSQHKRSYRYDWHLEINATIPDHPDYRGKFPILVEANPALQ